MCVTKNMTIRLFNTDDGELSESCTPEGSQANMKIERVINDLVVEFAALGYSLRDVETLLMSHVNTACSRQILLRRRDVRNAERSSSTASFDTFMLAGVSMIDVLYEVDPDPASLRDLATGDHEHAYLDGGLTISHPEFRRTGLPVLVDARGMRVAPCDRLLITLDTAIDKTETQVVHRELTQDEQRMIAAARTAGYRIRWPKP